MPGKLTLVGGNPSVELNHRVKKRQKLDYCDYHLVIDLGFDDLMKEKVSCLNFFFA
jgi:hypothetical protein